MIYIFCALILYTLAILLGTAAARNANTNLVSLITNITSVVVPLAVVIPNLSKKAVTSHRFGVIMAILSGVAIGVFVLALNKSIAENKLGIVTPIIYGGSILLTTVLSIFIFKEKVTFVESAGLLLVLAGIGLVVYARATV